MIRFILALIILCVCMVVGYFIRTFPATVSINVTGYTAQTNLVIWVILSLIAAAILWWLFKIVHFIWKSPQIFSRNLKTRKQRKADVLLKKGLNDLITGKYHRAEKRLAKGGELSEQLGASGVLYFENAAIAADRQHAESRRDGYLLKARQGDDGAHQLLTHLNEAELAVKNKDYAQAQKLLEALQSRGEKNPKIITLLDTVYAEQQEWQKAWQNLQKDKALSPEEKKAKRKIYAKGMLQDTPAIETYLQLNDEWRKLPADIRQEKDMAILYASSLAENTHYEEAEKFLATQIKKTHDLDYIQAYCDLTHHNFPKALHNMETWSKFYPDDAIFLYSRAQLAYHAKEYTLAEKYIESSLKQHASAEAFALWGKILEARNQPQAALAAYQQSIGGIIEHKPVVFSGELLPPPEKDTTN